MTTLDLSTCSHDLARSIAAIEEELSSAIVTEDESTVLAGSACAVGLDDVGLDQQLAIVHALRVAAVGELDHQSAEGNRVPVAPLGVPDRITPSAEGNRVPVAPLGVPDRIVPSAEGNRLLVAPLGVPDRITKRDYNYFDDLNAALKELRDKQGY
jgi:hypothetical protein